MRVPSDSGAREIGVGQEASFTVKGRAVAMETRGEEDHDVGLLPLALDLRVRDLLKGERRDGLPHIEGLADGPLRVLLPHFGSEVVYAVEAREDRRAVTFHLNGVITKVAVSPVSLTTPLLREF